MNASLRPADAGPAVASSSWLFRPGVAVISQLCPQTYWGDLNSNRDTKGAVDLVGKIEAALRCGHDAANDDRDLPVSWSQPTGPELPSSLSADKFCSDEMKQIIFKRVCSQNGDDTMDARAVWRGDLQLAMVRCKVALYCALKPGNGRYHFNLIADARSHPCVRPDKTKVERARTETRGVLEVEHFIAASTIDRIYWGVPHYLSPAGKQAAKSFSVILKAIEKSRQVAIGRFIVRQREYFCALEVCGNILLVTTLRTQDEVRSVAEAIGGTVRLPKPQAEMLIVAETIVEQISVRFKPDEESLAPYKAALSSRSSRDWRSNALDPAEHPAGSNVVNLIQALKVTLSRGGPEGERAKRFVAARHRALTWET